MLLGQRTLDSTAIYTRVALKTIREVPRWRCWRRHRHSGARPTNVADTVFVHHILCALA